MLHCIFPFIKLSKIAAKAKTMMDEAYREALGRSNICYEWFVNFKKDEFNFHDRSGPQAIGSDYLNFR